MFKLWKPELGADVRWTVDWTDPYTGPKSQKFTHWREGLAFMLGLALGRREQHAVGPKDLTMNGRQTCEGPAASRCLKQEGGR